MVTCVPAGLHHVKRIDLIMSCQTRSRISRICYIYLLFHKKPGSYCCHTLELGRWRREWERVGETAKSNGIRSDHQTSVRKTPLHINASVLHLTQEPFRSETRFRILLARIRRAFGPWRVRFSELGYVYL